VSRKPENTFIASVHRHLPVDLYHMKTHNAYISGPADVWYSGHVADIWVEYKYATHIPKSQNDYVLDLTPLQSEWLHARYLEGRRVYVILGMEQGGIIFQDLNWEDGHTKSMLEENVMNRKDIAEWISRATTGKYEAPTQSRNRRERCT